MIDVSKIKRNTGQTEASVYMTGNQTNRSLDPKSAQNAALDFTHEKWDLAKMQAVFSELLIRFDTAPQFYTKQDYEHLIRMIGNGFYSILVDSSKGVEIDTKMPDNPSDERVPSTKLLQTELEDLNSAITNKLLQIDDKIDSINDHLDTVDSNIAAIRDEMAKKSDLQKLQEDITAAYEQAIQQLEEELTAGLEGKADKEHTHSADDIPDFAKKVAKVIEEEPLWADITD